MFIEEIIPSCNLQILVLLYKYISTVNLFMLLVLNYTKALYISLSLLRFNRLFIVFICIIMDIII